MIISKATTVNNKKVDLLMRGSKEESTVGLTAKLKFYGKILNVEKSADLKGKKGR